MQGKIGWRVAAKAAGVLAGAYGVTLATVWATQEKLLFKPDPFSRVGQAVRALRGARPSGRRVREWVYKAPDGVSIQGFLSEPRFKAAGGCAEAVIYLGGIREESSWTLEHAHRFGERAFVCVNYRGYGLSGGRPEQAKILHDCQQALAMLVEQGHLRADGIHLVGRSLGSGVAGFLCSKVGAKRICLVTPYDSVLSVAKSKYWFLPVGLLFRHPFDAMPWARENAASMLMLLSERDDTVPHAHSERLFGAWAGPKRAETLEGTDHSSIVRHPRFFERVASFFDEPERAPNARAATS